MNLLPSNFEGMLELKTVESYILFVILIIKELIGQFSSNILYVLSTLYPSNISRLLLIVTINIRFHSLSNIFLTLWYKVFAFLKLTILNLTLVFPQFLTVKLNHCRCPLVFVSMRM